MRRPTASALAAAAAAALVALAATGCGSPSSTPTRASALPPDFAGIVTEDAFAHPGAYRRKQLARQAAAGIGVVRQTFRWSDIETRPGHYDLRPYDSFVLDAARAGMSVLPIVFGAPAFRVRPLRKGLNPNTAAPPRDPRAMARFATVLVRRYGPGGSLWREHRSVRPHPITAWQVWNEPNLPVYWGDHPNAAQYTALLRVVGAAIHRADPRAQVVTAGLPQSTAKNAVPFEIYLKAMYAAGAQGSFDVLAINAYSQTVAGMEAAIVTARRITASAEDGDVPIWVTEFGWATRPGPRSPFTVSRTKQARLLRDAIRTLAAERVRLRLRGLVYYAWRDAKPYPGGRDFWGLHTGLLTRDGRPKPALRSLEFGVRAARAAAAR